MRVTSDVGFVPSVTTQTKSFFRLSGHEKNKPCQHKPAYPAGLLFGSDLQS